VLWTRWIGKERMNAALRILACGLLMPVVSSMLAQQQSKTIVDSAGNKVIMDVNTGWTQIMKDGQTDKTSAVDANNTCETSEKYGLLNQPKDRAFALLCDEWWRLQPKTEIERVPFQSLVRRLLLESRASTTFVRYRGMDLRAAPKSTTYDATIVPSDIGRDVSCSIEEEDRDSLGMMYTYECTIKTDSFPAAIALKDRMVQTVKALGLKEDEIREHGLAVHAKEVAPCAPGGECLFQNVYASTETNWKNMQIMADPVFTRNTMAEVMALQNGGHAGVSGIASDEGTVSFQIFSVGPKNGQ
jgi:hypothetical protein